MNTIGNTKRILIFLVMVSGVVTLAGRTAYADFTFGRLENLGPVINSSVQEMPLWVSPDGLSLWFQRTPTSVNDPPEFLVATRATKDDPWGTPVSVGLYGDPASIFKTIGVVPGFTTGDGLEMYFSDYPTVGGYGSYDLWMMKRDRIGANWCQPVNLGPVVNSSAGEVSPTISLDGLELYFNSGGTAIRPGGYGSSDLWVTRRATRNDPWTEPVNLGPTVNTASRENFPVLSGDGLLLFFYSTRPGGYGQADLYMMRRASLSDSWGPPVNLGPFVNSTVSEYSVYMSADGSTLFFNSDRPGGYGGHDCWQVSILPNVDFNNDGKVDLKDFSKLAQYWGQDEPSVDIGPMPWGDGRVDIQDIAVLVEHWLKGF
jgi:hypothetical protein